MEKKVMMVSIAPKTREKLEKMKDCTGLAFGVIIDTLVSSAEIQKYCDKPFDEKDNGEKQ